MPRRVTNPERDGHTQSASARARGARALAASTGPGGHAILSALEHAPDFALVATDAEGTITGWNRGADVILGWSKQEALGRKIDMLFTPEDRARGIVGQEMAVATAQGRAGDERWHLRQNGVRFWASGMMIPMPGFGGAAGGYLKIMQDKTLEHEAVQALRRSEAALRENEARFRAMADNIPQLAWMARPDGSIPWFNQRWYDYTGTTPALMEGRGWRALVHPDHLDRATKHFTERVAAGEPWEDTFPLRGHDGEYRWFLSRARPIRDRLGRIELWFGTNTDVTESRAAEASNAHLAAVVACSDDAVVSLAPEDGRVLTWNVGAERLFGYAAAEIVGTPSARLLPPDLPEADKTLFAQAMAGTPVISFETIRLSKAGERIPVSITARRMLTADQRIIGVSSMFTDLRPRRRTEAALRESEAQLRQAQKLEAIGRLAAGVAHDFNNILQGVTGGLELVLDDVEPGTTAREFLELALGSARRGSTLTQQLLSYARKQMLRPQVIELAPFLADMQRLLARTLGPHIAIEARAHGRTPPIHVDPGQLETALLNLAINAAHAMPKGGTLLLDAQQDSHDRDRVVIAVTDTGKGMDEATLAMAFEPFFTTKGVQGTGLGLSMVEGFTEQSGGYATIASAPGKGTTVMLWLPTDARAGRPDQQAGAASNLKGAGRILLADDSADVLATAAAVLDRAGFEVVRARDGLQALSLLAAGPDFDLLVSDYAMPGLNGVDLIEQARAAHPGLRALLMTGYAEVNEAERLPQGVAVLGKPFQRTELIAAAMQALGRSQVRAAPAFTEP